VSLFAHLTRSHRGPGRDYLQSRRNARDERLGAFADHIAEGVSIAVAARLVGVSEAYGRVMLQNIRRQLGWQAQ